MSHSTVYKYRVYCVTEGAYFITWSETPPTTCPNNNTHTIDPTKTVIIDKVTSEEIRDASGKTVIHETSRILGTTTYFASRGDNPADITSVGGGERFEIVHKIGDPTEQSVYMDLNIVENKTYIHEGYMMWKGAEGDTGTMGAVPSVTPVTPSSGTNFNLYGGYLVIGAAGDGTIDVNPADIKLVEMVPSQDFGDRPQAFWDCDYNTTTHQFELGTLTFKPSGDGHYNIFAAEVPLGNHVNEIILVDFGFIMLQTADATELGHGMRLKLTGRTYGDDHDWRLSNILTFHRYKTV